MVKDFPNVPGSVARVGQTASLAKSLLVQVQALDPVAWQRLVQLFGPVVYAWCRRAGLQADDAADVGQEVFQAVAAGVARFRRDRPGDSFRGWLFGITNHKVQDFWRRQVAQPQAAGGSDARDLLAQVALEISGPSLTGSNGLRGEGLRRVLDLVRAEFEDRTWQAFWRLAVEGQSPADIAAALGISANAVYIAKSRVLRRLREEMGDLLS